MDGARDIVGLAEMSHFLVWIDICERANHVDHLQEHIGIVEEGSAIAIGSATARQEEVTLLLRSNSRTCPSHHDLSINRLHHMLPKRQTRVQSQ